MYADDVQWGLNRTRGEYELFIYNINSGSNRVVALEFAPMQLHALCRKIMDTIERDFPAPKERNTGEQSTDSSPMGASSANTAEERR